MFSSPAPGVRSGTGSDVVAAVAAQAVEPVAVALPMMAAGVATTVRLVDLAARSLPELFRKSLCEGIPGPTLAHVGERLELPAPGGTESAPWQFVAARPLVPPRPGPLAHPSAALDSKPVEMELRPGSDDGLVQLSIWSGGWVICALPTLQVDVDGQPLHTLRGAQLPLDLVVNADSRSVHVTAALPKSLIRTLLTADGVTIRWDTGSATVRPSASEAAQQLAARLAVRDPPP